MHASSSSTSLVQGLHPTNYAGSIGPRRGTVKNQQCVVHPSLILENAANGNHQSSQNSGFAAQTHREGSGSKMQKFGYLKKGMKTNSSSYKLNQGSKKNIQMNDEENNFAQMNQGY